MVSGHHKSTGIPRVDGLSTGPPSFRASQLGIRALVNDYLGSSGVGIHKYGSDTSSSQLGIKSLGTRVPRADGYGSRS